jgi:hypothetical protein
MHSYLKGINADCLKADASERKHLEMINHLQERISAERFRKTPEERLATLSAIRNYPNKNHAPVHTPS